MSEAKARGKEEQRAFEKIFLQLRLRLQEQNGQLSIMQDMILLKYYNGVQVTVLSCVITNWNRTNYYITVFRLIRTKDSFLLQLFEDQWLHSQQTFKTMRETSDELFQPANMARKCFCEAEMGGKQ